MLGPALWREPNRKGLFRPDPRPRRLQVLYTVACSISLDARFLDMIIGGCSLCHAKRIGRDALSRNTAKHAPADALEVVTS